jgi:hypothetical protein
MQHLFSVLFSVLLRRQIFQIMRVVNNFHLPLMLYGRFAFNTAKSGDFAEFPNINLRRTGGAMQAYGLHFREKQSFTGYLFFVANDKKRRR